MPLAARPNHSTLDPRRDTLPVRETAQALSSHLVRFCPSADTVVLLLSRNVLLRASSLFEMYQAVRQEKKLITVHLAQGGYDYAAASATLQDLPQELKRQAPGEADKLTKMLGGDKTGTKMKRLQALLRDALPNIITISWQPHAGANHTASVIEDITRGIQAGERASVRMRVMFLRSVHCTSGRPDCEHTRRSHISWCVCAQRSGPWIQFTLDFLASPPSPPSPGPTLACLTLLTESSLPAFARSASRLLSSWSSGYCACAPLRRATAGRPTWRRRAPGRQKWLSRALDQAQARGTGLGACSFQPMGQ